ncbi:MAG: HlyD family secretion protein [Deferribacteres bacterium]|nr:HlyD family secretion protein [Deferribacteres bacterium]
MDEKQDSAGNHKKKRTALAVFAAFLAVGLIAIYFYIQHTKTHITTDDAYVRGAIHMVSPKVSGTVLKVHAADNRMVKKGDLLVELEPDLFVQRLREAESALKAEENRLSGIEAMIRAQEKKVAAADAALARTRAGRDELAALLEVRKAEEAAKTALLRQAALDLRRAENLVKKGVIPQDRYDRANTAYETSLSALKAAQEMKKQAEVSLRAHASVTAQAEASLKAEKAVLQQLKASLKTQKEQIRRMSARLELARLNLSYTKVYAPVDGYVTRKSVEAGDQVMAGRPVMAIVPLNDIYVIANYKETKIERLRPGQEARIEVDAYPGRVFTGRVDSIMAGTGVAFSLFPPENATGNYVKVVQRIPVKIVLEQGADAGHLLRVGMSTVVTVLAK